MANRVRIDVSADLGDTIAKLEAVAAALRHVKNAGGEATVTVDKNTSAMSKMETAAKDAAKGLDEAAQVIGGSDSNSFANAVKRSDNALHDVGRTMRDTERVTKDVGKGFYDIGHAIDGLSEKTQAFIKSNSSNGFLGLLTKGLLNTFLRFPLEIAGLGANLGQNAVPGLASLLGIGGTGGGTAATGGLGATATALGAVGSAAGVAAAALGLVVTVMVTIAGVAGVAAAALTALADVLGTGLVIVQTFLGPLALLVTLLGGLGGAFFLAGQRALKGGGHLQEFADKVATTQSMFGHLVRVLAGDFLPIFDMLISDAQRAILYFDKLAKMPLAEAFHQMATTGVRGFMDFLNQIGHLVAHPLRLAIKIAFGQSGPVTDAVNSLFTSIQNYLFGYTRTHQIHIGRFLGATSTTEVKGALQPFLNWWDKQNFTKRGIELGHDITDGLLKSGFAKNFGQFLMSVLGDSARVGVAVFKFVLAAEFRKLGQLLQGALGKKNWDTIKSSVNSVKTAFDAVKTVVNAIVDKVGGWKTVLHKVADALTNGVAVALLPIKATVDLVKLAWDAIHGDIHGSIGAVVKLGSDLSALIQPLQEAVSLAQALASALSSSSAPLPPHGTGTTPGRGGGGVGPTGHLAARVVNIHVHGADLSTSAQRRVVAQQLSGELARIWSMGHAV